MEGNRVIWDNAAPISSLPAMRLTTAQIQTIERAACQYFGADAAVWLFGSRTDDDKKGGDYDFLVETSLDSPDALIQQKIAMLLALQSSRPFEDEKIDLVIKRRNSSFELPIYTVAQQQGIKL